MMYMSEIIGSMSGLPDPEHDHQFYDGVPGRRLAAWVIDVVIILGIGVPVGLIFGVVTLGLGFLIFPFVLAAVSFLYRVMTISGRSATWGMRVMGIELRRHDGTRFELGSAFLHTTAYMVSVGFVVVQAISCAAMLTTRYGQGIPDFILRSAAINTPVD